MLLFLYVGENSLGTEQTTYLQRQQFLKYQQKCVTDGLDEGGGFDIFDPVGSIMDMITELLFLFFKFCTELLHSSCKRIISTL